MRPFISHNQISARVRFLRKKTRWQRKTVYTHTYIYFRRKYIYLYVYIFFYRSTTGSPLRNPKARPLWQKRRSSRLDLEDDARENDNKLAPRKRFVPRMQDGAESSTKCFLIVKSELPGGLSRVLWSMDRSKARKAHRAYLDSSIYYKIHFLH